jgi:hypothetical protein
MANTLIVFLAEDGQPPASGNANLDQVNSHLVVSYPQGVLTGMNFEGVLPRNYGGAGVTVTLWWLAASAVAGAPWFGVQFERHQSGTTNLTADSFGAAQTANPTAPGTFGIVKATPIVFTDGTQMNGVLLGESFRLKVYRDGTNGSDNMLGAAQLLAIEIQG